jgi:hypothetical protein
LARAAEPDRNLGVGWYMGCEEFPLMRSLFLTNVRRDHDKTTVAFRRVVKRVQTRTMIIYTVAKINQDAPERLPNSHPEGE